MIYEMTLVRFRIGEAEPQAYDMHPIAVFGQIVILMLMDLLNK